MGEYVIEARDLRKVYPGGIEAVKGVSFRVRRGEIYGFLGPNGAGKTTTLGMLTTVIKPTSGTAIVAGYDVTRNPVEVRARIGVVFQDPTIDRDLTAWQNMYIHGLIHGVPRSVLEKRIPELLRMVGLEKFMHTRLRYYSGGMIRRLEIARALINTPEVLFLDEPTIGLDPQARAKVWEVIRSLKKQGVTVFLTTHYMDEADKLCDRIAIIDHGRIIAEGTPEELKSMVGGDIIYIRVVGDGASFARSLAERGWKTKTLSDGLIAISVRDAPRALPEIMMEAARRRLQIVEVRYVRPSLDDVFLHLTGRSLRDSETEGWKEIARMMVRRRMR